MATGRAQRLQPFWIALLAVAAPFAAAQESSTVIGPPNPPLQEGAEALLAGDAAEGVRLTLLGLAQAGNMKERHTAWSNLCAGYVMLGDLETGLEFCDRVIAETDRNWRAYSNRALIYIRMQRFEDADEDLKKCEALSPNARTIKAVRAMWLDAVEPVAPSIVIDDRRRRPGEDDED
jgi:tetratricopeptide (TPR) repeat protein